MTGYMFRSKIGALVFVGLILLAVFRMVGTEEQGGELVRAAEQVEAQQDAAAAMTGQSQQDWQKEALDTGGWAEDTPPPAW